MPDFLKLMQQAQEMTGKLQEVQESLGKLSVTGSAGAGLVTVEVDGRGHVKRVSIDPKVVNPADVEMLEDLVAVAVQEAQRKARELAEQEMKKAAGGLGLGGMGLGGLPFKLPV
jgi:nucleoid-associated protein EbfC